MGDRQAGATGGRALRDHPQQWEENEQALLTCVCEGLDHRAMRGGMYRWQLWFGNKALEIVEEQLGECSQTAECLPDKREASGSSSGPATKKEGGEERKKERIWGQNINQRTGRRTENKNAEIRQKRHSAVRTNGHKLLYLRASNRNVCFGSTHHSSAALGWISQQLRPVHRTGSMVPKGDKKAVHPGPRVECQVSVYTSPTSQCELTG